MKHFERLRNEMFPKTKKTTPIPQIIVDAVQNAGILTTLATTWKRGVNGSVILVSTKLLKIFLKSG
jgi:hypothetical protein